MGMFTFKIDMKGFNYDLDSDKYWQKYGLCMLQFILLGFEFARFLYYLRIVSTKMGNFLEMITQCFNDTSIFILFYLLFVLFFAISFRIFGIEFDKEDYVYENEFDELNDQRQYSLEWWKI